MASRKRWAIGTVGLLLVAAAVVLGVLGGMGYFSKKSSGSSRAPNMPYTPGQGPSPSPGPYPDQCDNNIINLDVNPGTPGEPLTGNIVFNWYNCGSTITSVSDLWGQIIIGYNEGSVGLTFTNLQKMNDVNWSVDFTSKPVSTKIPPGYYSQSSLNMLVSNNIHKPLVRDDFGILLN